MENRVYYGEYSLRHWINLILKGNITLPKYQRTFVWKEAKVAQLIRTFEEKQFVPPVTIGAFKDEDSTSNYILDGQQRLTSIFLAYLGLFPDPDKYKLTIERFLDESGDEVEEEDDLPFDDILEWNFHQLTKKGASKKGILSKIEDGNYKHTQINLKDDFLDNNFLGFSYLVPQSKDKSEQQRYYSSVFRNINIQGEPLLPQESRASLYFLDEKLEGLFSPDFCKKITMKLLSNKATADFVRYLSLTSQYKKNSDEKKVARGYKPKMEVYYEEYIYSAVRNDESPMFGKFTRIFPDKNFEARLIRLDKTLEALSIFGEYKSIIDIDAYLFGLVFHIVINDGFIDLDKKEDIQSALERLINSLKKEDGHQRSPNNLQHLRHRIERSISLYRRFIVHGAR
ncbi:MAG TPA: DUF262 domain-containing protein [Glaciecola sp.]|nr:DUF262 domain-containing protein [Glaciecola sp.]